MADNVTLSQGTLDGAVMATDDISSVHYQRIKVTFGTDGSATDVSASNPLPVLLSDGGSVVDSNNSTTTPLGISGVFTGTGTDLLGYTAVTCTLYADQDSATDGLTAQFSTDNTNWDDSYAFTMDVSASNTRRFQFPICSRYFRLVYTNGTTGQSAFRVQTILHTGNQLTSIHRLADDMNPDRSAQVVKSVLYAQAAGTGDFTAVDATSGGNLKVSIEEASASVPVGQDSSALYDGTTSLTPKFAVIDDATSGDNELVAAVATKKIRVLAYTLVAAGTVTARFEDGAGGTALSGQMELAAQTVVSVPFAPCGHFETTANTALSLELSAAVSVDGHLTYVEV